MTSPTANEWQEIEEIPEPGKSRRDWFRIVIAVALWTFLALIGTTTAYIAMRGEEIDLWIATFGPMSAYYVVWAAIAPLIYRIVRRGVDSPARLASGLAMHGVLLVAINAGQAWLLQGDAWFAWLASGPGRAFVALGVTIYLMIIFICLALKYYTRLLERERTMRHIALAAKTLENDLNLARLDLVSTQFRPHFLFNALNGITALIERREYERATEMVYRLGQLLRATLLRFEADESTLDDEVRFATEYVDLQRLRAPGEIHLIFDVSPEAAEALVPPMILQPIVENSIKYSGRGTRSVTEIRIQARVSDERLHIRVADNGEFRSSAGCSKRGAGYGLKSVRERLAIHYGDTAVLDIGAARSAGTVVSLELPLHYTRTDRAA